MQTQVDDVTDPAVLAQVAEQLWGVLAEVDDPDCELTMSTASRRRLEGAALGLEALTGRSTRVGKRSSA